MWGYAKWARAPDAAARDVADNPCTWYQVVGECHPCRLYQTYIECLYRHAVGATYRTI